MNRNTKYKWFVLDMIIFTALNIWLLSMFQRDIDFLTLLTPLKLFLFGLASYRLADVISTEKVTEGFRSLFMKKTFLSEDKWEPVNGEFRGSFGELISCPSCTGVWGAAGLFYLYVFFPAFGSAAIIIFALSAFERFFSKVYNFFDDMSSKMNK